MCRLQGSEQKLTYPLPIYQTMWSRGRGSKTFTVVTFHGHHEQECAGGWTIAGQGALADAVSYGHLTQFGFSLEGALYDRR